MRYLLAILLACHLSAATWYVATTGDDTGDGNLLLDPFRTVQAAVDVAIAGDTIEVAAGEYGEYVTTQSSGSAGSRITLRGTGEAVIRALRLNNHTHWTIDGITFRGAQGGPTGTWSEMLRIEASAHNGIVTNCTFGPSPVLNRTNWVFDVTDSSISSPSGSDWSAAGFVVGGRIRTGASGIEPYLFINQDRNLTITGITADKAFVSPAILTETNAAAWSVIYPSASTHIGIRPIGFILTGGTAATNWVVSGNTLTNIYAIGIDTTGPGPTTISDNRISTTAWSGIRLGGSDLVVSNNLFIDIEKFLFYSVRESEDVPHPLGAGEYDFVQGYFRTETTGSNVQFVRNWVQNVHNPLGQIGTVGAPNWLVESNVFVGVQSHWSGLGRLTDSVFKNNTFYRVSFDTGSSASHAMIHSTGVRHTNVWNAYIDVGNHSNTNTEGFYANASVVDSRFTSNFVASAESLGWQGSGSFLETFGYNGGNPMLQNPQDPLGPDGIPFTNDDGLRPMPLSLLSLNGLGALTPVTATPGTPIVSFSVAPATPGWFDLTGTNFNTAWESVPPFARTNYVRPWDTVEAIGKVPAVVNLDASATVSSHWATNHWFGVKLWTIDWGDGAVVQSWTRTNHHTYLWPGTFTVTVTADTFGGTSASATRTYRVLAQDGYAGTVHHVAVAGNDTTGDGSYANPYATIAKGVLEVAAGDYIAVHPGTYPVDVDMNRNVASSGSRIAIHGFDALVGAFRMRHPYWTVHGFEVNGTNSVSGAGVYIYKAAHHSWVVNCYIRDLGGSLFGGVYGVGSGPDFNPTTQNAHSRIIGCTFTNIEDVNISIFGGSNWVVSGVRALDSKGEGDFIRPRGAGHMIQDSYISNMDKQELGGHPDIIQLDNQSGAGYWFKDLTFQRLWVEGNTNSTTDAALGQIETGAFGDDVRYTNMVVRNSVFIDVRAAMSDSNDGLKFYNNLFVRTPRDGANITAGGDPEGGTRGSSYGTRFANNVFYGGGLGGTNPARGWYYNAQSGAQAFHTTIEFADYNYVGGTDFSSKQIAPPNSSDRWASAGMEVYGINGGDPGFVNVASGDWRLTESSILRGVGFDLTDTGFATDYFGNSRASGAWDIGPFQGWGDVVDQEIPIPVPISTVIRVNQLRTGGIQGTP